MPQRPAVSQQRRSTAAAKKKKERTTIITLSIIAAALLIAVIVGVCIILFRKPADDGLIHKNVFAAGVNLGGMTPEQAADALHKATDDTYSQLDMSIRVLDSELLLAPKDTGVSLDVEAVVKAAYDYGRNGSQSQGASYTVSILPYLSLDTAYIQDAIQKLGAAYSTTLKETSYTISGTRPNLSNSEIDTSVVHQTLTIQMGTAEYGLNIEKLYQQVMDAYNINLFEVVANCTERAPAALDCEKLYRELCTEPINAEFDPDTYDITPEQYGYGFKLADLLSAVDNAQYGEIITLELRYITPDITADFYSNEMFQDVLATFTTSTNGDAGWNTNLKLVCELLDGMILKSGDEFSFNQLVGEPTTRKGYCPVNIYVGKSYREVIGGGISQVASTLYNCALLADLDVLERHSHSYAPTFVDVGFDAEVYYGQLDFRFRNSTDQPIRIDASVSGSKVTIQLIGTDNRDYTVEIIYKVDKTKEPTTVYNTMTEDNPGGYKEGDVLTQAITGYDISTYMRKYSKNTGSLISENLIVTSIYSKLDQVVVKIETTAPPPDEPTDPSEPTDSSEPTDTSDPSTPETEDETT